MCHACLLWCLRCCGEAFDCTSVVAVHAHLHCLQSRLHAYRLLLKARQAFRMPSIIARSTAARDASLGSWASTAPARCTRTHTSMGVYK